MRKTLLFLACVSFSAQAQNVRVTKVSGKKAIVVRESGPPLKVGQLLTGGGELNEDDLDSAVGGSSSFGGKSAGRRDHIVGGSAQLATTSTDNGAGTKTSGSVIGVNAIYGWNKKIMEYGPRFNLRRSSSGNTSSTAFGFGGFFDYNFSPNVPGAQLLYAAGATLDYSRTSSSAGGATPSTIELFVGPALKWFPLGNAVAFRTDAGLGYARTSAGNATATATTFGVKAGFQIYF